MKRFLEFLLLLSLICLSFSYLSHPRNAEAASGSGASITFDGWGDTPEPEPGEEGPQGSGTVQPPTEKPSGSLLKAGELINTSLTLLGFLNVSMTLFLFWFIRSNRRLMKIGGETE